MLVGTEEGGFEIVSQPCWDFESCLGCVQCEWVSCVLLAAGIMLSNSTYCYHVSEDVSLFLT